MVGLQFWQLPPGDEPTLRCAGALTPKLPYATVGQNAYERRHATNKEMMRMLYLLLMSVTPSENRSRTAAPGAGTVETSLIPAAFVQNGASCTKSMRSTCVG